MTVGYVRTGELNSFVKRVSQLRAEGLSTRDIARRLAVPVSTMNERLRKHREQQEGAHHDNHADPNQQQEEQRAAAGA